MPEGWVQTPKTNTTTGSTAGAPIVWNDPANPEDATAGYGYIADDTTDVEDIYYFHSDHLGSTSYVTDRKGNITQYDAYLPYGELLVNEHSSSEDMPYKFNGKEMDEETGLYYYGARYMNPVAGIWYGVDPLVEKYTEIGAYVYGANNPIKRVDPNGMGWYETNDKRAHWDDRIGSKDSKFLPKGAKYIGQTVDLFDSDGNYSFGNENGELTDAHQLDDVVVKGDKDYRHHHTFGYQLLGDFRYSDQGYGPWNPDAVSFGVGGNITFAGETIELEMGVIVTGGKISPYCTLLGGIDTENIYNFFRLKGSINPFKMFSANAYGNFIMYENLNKNNLNSFASYRGLGISNSLSAGNLGFSYGSSAEQRKNGYYETNQSKSFGISLNANPARLDLSKEGGNTWIPFF